MAQTESKNTGADMPGLEVFTLAIWLTLLSLGIVGLTFDYPRPLWSRPESPVTKAELIHVQLAPVPVEHSQKNQPEISPAQPPPLSAAAAPPKAPAMIAVAEPSPKIAFALPVTGPVQVVEAATASYVRPREEAPPVSTSSLPTVQTLTFGQGEAVQPEPDYPLRAQREGQEGTVIVQFVVGSDGSVLSADASKPSPWKMLNDAAIRAVRERWHFRSGSVRTYQVAIRFQIRK